MAGLFIGFLVEKTSLVKVGNPISDGIVSRHSRPYYLLANMFFSFDYGLRQMEDALTCTFELWAHLGGLLSTQEA